MIEFASCKIKPRMELCSFSAMLNQEKNQLIFTFSLAGPLTNICMGKMYFEEILSGSVDLKPSDSLNKTAPFAAIEIL